MIHLDTHVVVWLFAGDLGHFPPPVLERLEAEDLEISPMVVLELEYLFEIGRISVGGEAVLRDLEPRIGLKLCQEPLQEIIFAALARRWTRDPIDRIIASQAEIAGVKLLTKDEALRDHEDHALWG